MFLSRIAFDRQNSWARQSLKNCHDMHRTIMQAFPDSEAQARSEYNVLYRLQVTNDSAIAYVQSKSEPDWNKLLGKGVCVQGCKNIDNVCNTIKNDMQMCFNLLVCPTKKQKREDKNSTRVYLTSPEERFEWLQRKGNDYGFKIISCREQAETSTFGTHKQAEGGNMYLKGVCFTGELCVCDKEKFLIAYREGIGAEKAYGFGLLLLSRA